MTRCSRGTGKCQCGASHYLTSSPREVVKEVITHTSGKTIKIEDEINCKTRSCLYVLESTKDPRKRQYADLTRGRDPHQAARLRYQLGPGQAGPQPLQVDGKHQAQREGDTSDEDEEQQPLGQAAPGATLHQPAQPNRGCDQHSALSCSWN